MRTQQFKGHVQISPALSNKEIDYLIQFSQTQHLNNDSIKAPSTTCSFAPSADGTKLEWNGIEFNHAPEWLMLLVHHFIGSEPFAKKINPKEFGFLQGHNLSGKIIYNCVEEDEDNYYLVIDGNQVLIKR